MATRYNYTGGIVTNGLVLNLDAAKVDSYPGTGTTWRDISGNNNNGTLTNGPTFSGIGKQASIVFDGVDDYVTTSNSFNITSVTLEVWFLLNSTGSTFVLAQSWLYGGPSNGPGFTIESVGSNLAAAVGGSNDGIYPGYALSNFPLNTVSQVVFSYDVTLNTQVLYKNGINVSSTTTGTRTRADSNQPFYIGQANNGGRNYNGRVYNTKLYNRALSADEVSQNFNALRGRYGI
jgi:hypothetical protein